MQNSKRGFTLAELLVVVAVIAVLTAIAIPVFAAQTEKSREAADAANIRAQYAEVMTEAIDEDSDVNTGGSMKVTLKQTRDGWQSDAFPGSLGNLGTIVGAPAKGGSAWVEFQQDGAVVTIHFEGGSGGGESGGGTGGDEPGDAPQYTPDDVVTLWSGGDLHKKTTLSVSIPGDAISSANAITIYIRKNPGNGQVTTETVTLTPGVNVEETFGIDVKNNGSITVTFSENIDQSSANKLLKYFSVS